MFYVEDSLSKRARGLIFALSMVLALAIGVVDYATGYEISTTVFYLLPISLSAWYVGRRAGFLLAALCALTWFVADAHLATPHYSHYLIPYWNALMIGCVFSTVAFLVAKVCEEMKNLLRQTELLRSSNAELEHFAKIASHDLQAPLHTIGGFLDLLQRRCGGRLDAESHRCIDHALSGVDQMQTLIRNLLKYATVESRQLSFELIDSEAVLARAIANLQKTFEEHHAAVTHDPLPQLRSDSTLMLQVFQNLLSNAVKYRNHEPPRIHVGVQKTDSDWLFSVADNGIGISPGDRERVFMMFERAASDATEGSGVGLAVCKRIVQRHGGRIWVESQPQKGSTFYFSLPAAPLADR